MMKKLLALLLTLMLLSACLAETPADTIRNVQIRLGELGYYPGEVSGEADEVTATAIGNFQRANGITVTGTPDPATIEKLMAADAVDKQTYLLLSGQVAKLDVSLKKGDSGKKVKSLQNYLILLGYLTGESDGAYENGTMRAVALFQAVNGLPITGQADAATISLMASSLAVPAAGFEALGELSYGSGGSLVKQLQLFLKNAGYFTGECTGVFGRKTQEAVLKFQQRNALPETGKWDILLFAQVSGGLYIDKAASEQRDADVILKTGDSGYLVSEIKNRLNVLGFLPTIADDIYDEKTEKAMRLFQEANGIEQTGMADGVTREKLMGENAVSMELFTNRCLSCTLRPGDTGYAVYLMTGRLYVLGYDVEQVYEFDDTVSDAVRIFRRASGLTDGNVADAEMRALLNSENAISFTRAEPIFNEINETEGYARRYELLLATARECVGKPYEAGKVGPDSFGAGGLIYYCFSRAEFELAPTVSLQLENAQTDPGFTADPALITPGGQIFLRADDTILSAVTLDDGTAVYASVNAGFAVMASIQFLLDSYEFIGFIGYISPV